jgi:hypothetical protein
VAQSARLNLQRREGGVLELTKAPLVRIRDKRNSLRADDLFLDLLVRDEKSRLSQFVIEPGIDEPPPVRLVDGIDLAEDLAVLLVNVSAGIAERRREARLRPPRCCRYLASERATRKSSS